MKNLFSLLMLLLLPLCLHGQNAEKYMFRHLDVKEGLSNSQVNQIFKDSRGYMWFATAYGLNRYDGYSFRIFENSPGDTTSLPDNYVGTIQELSDGNLLILSGAGYSLYDVKKDRFSWLSPYLKERGILASVSCVYVDSLKHIWCYAPHTGCYQFQPDSGKLIVYPREMIADTLAAASMISMFQAPEGVIMVYSNGRITCLDRSKSALVYLEDYLPNTVSLSSSKMSVYVDREGVYWIYTKEGSGLWTYDHTRKQWTYSNTAPSAAYRLSSNIVTDVAQDANGRIWVATDHGGVAIIDKKTKKVRTLIHDPEDEHSLPQNSLISLFSDNQQEMWVGSYKMGVSFYAESMFKFGSNDLSKNTADLDLDEDVNTVAEDKNGLLWFGTNGNGLFSVNRATGQKVHYQHKPGDDASLSDNVIVSLCVSRDGRLWVGTYQGGMDCYHEGRFTHYRHDSSNPNSPANNSIWAIEEDESATLWVGTLGKGLQRFNPSDNSFVTFNNGQESLLSSEYISSICIGRDGILYIGTALGITVFDPKTNKTDFIYGNKEGNQRFSSQNINQVYEDSRGLLWVGTRDGLNVVDRKNDAVTTLYENNGLPDAFICGIIEDEFKNMWITTQKGICTITVNVQPQEGTYTFSMIKYDRLDGLRSSEFNIRSIAGLSDGEILMGGLQGVDRFSPKDLRYNKSLPRVVFTGLKLFDQEVRVDSVYDGNRILLAPMDMTQRIELNKNQNMITLSFSTMNYILPEKVSFNYLLEGVNKEWKKAQGNRITCSNLAPGTYRLRVKATNNDGYQNKKEATLVIVVRASFWRSTSVILFNGIASFFLIVLLYFYVKRVVKDRKLQRLKQSTTPLQRGMIDPEPEPELPSITSQDELLIKRTTKYVEDHIADSELSVEEMSRDLGMSRGHLYKKLTVITGKSPIEFIRVIRLKRAALLLQESQLNISEVAYKVGFNNPKYFSKYFKEEFGVLPSEYHHKVGHITNDTPSGNI
ncbi:MAG TPA: two-component regulator propeller domain-containing protein [Bacteroidales bacterium]